MKPMNYFKSKILGTIKNEFTAQHTDIAGALENAFKNHQEENHIVNNNNK